MSKRIISLGVAFAILLTFALGRCGYINFSNSYKVDSSYNSITVDISTLFTNIYSRNGVLLNNNTHSLYAVIKPSEKSMAELKYLYSNDDIKYITDELKKGEKIQLVGFGTFEVSTRAAREGRNPQTGETMTIEASKSPKFKAGKALKDVVNGK